MADHHGGNGDAQRVGSVKRRAARVLEEERLNPKFHRRAKRRGIDGRIAGQGGGHHPSRRGKRRASRRQAVNRIRHQRAHNRHVEAVGAQRGDASVPKEDGLNREGNGMAQNGCPRPQDDRRDRHAHRVPRGAAGQRQVEHHDHKRE